MMQTINLKELQKKSKPLHVLYVEDNKEVREQTYKMLSNFFDTITTAVDGDEGFETFRNGHFDIVITDINMPNTDGLKMVEKIREIDSDIVCIVISAHDETNHFTKSIMLGVDGYLLKPIEIKPFLRLLQKSVTKIDMHQQQEAYKTALERKVAERTEALKRQLYTDDLTGIGSRYAFLQELLECENGSTPVLFLLNIDAFTIYNELYGIEVGNEILIAFARELETFAEANGYRVFRISGDEFVLYRKSPSMELEKSEETIRKLFALFKEKPLFIESIEEYIQISATIGVSFSCENPLGKADMAMKAAKKSAKKFATYHPGMDTKADLKKTLYWRRELEQALTEDRVVPFFQPIVDRNGQITKYEALMRIKQYDENGAVRYVSPYEFLDIAIKTKQYDALSFRLIKNAIKYMKQREVSLSLNINLSDIYNPELIKMLREEILSFNRCNLQNGTTQNHIILEILENDNIEHYHLLTDKLVQFKYVAAKIAIDDFGSGYSNFSHIIGISPDYLKIDASLIKDIDTNRKSYEMVKAIVQFAKSLHIKTIAEFVASEKIFKITYDLGVDEFQGYYFGKPLPIEEIEATSEANASIATIA